METGPIRGKDGHLGLLPSYLWDYVGVSTLCFQGSGSLEFRFQFSWPCPMFLVLFCGSRQRSFTELERSLTVGIEECFGNIDLPLIYLSVNSFTPLHPYFHPSIHISVFWSYF